MTQLCATSMFTIVPAASAFAQDSHQHTETTPPEAASPRMPPEMMQMMQMMQKMHSGAMPRMAMMGGSFMAPGGKSAKVLGSYRFPKGRTQNDRCATEAVGPVCRRPTDECKSAKCCLQRNDERNDERSGCWLEQQEKMLTLQLDALKRSRAALEGLNAVLSDEQKRQLDELNLSRPGSEGAAALGFSCANLVFNSNHQNRNLRPVKWGGQRSICAAEILSRACRRWVIRDRGVPAASPVMSAVH